MAAKSKKLTVKRGRRSREEVAAGRWRLSVREITERDGPYTWTAFMVQGFKSEAGKWARRKFKTRAAAEAFVAHKSLEHMTREDGLRPVMSVLSTEQVREAEAAFRRLEEIQRALPPGTPRAGLLEAVEHYAGHLLRTVAVERVELREARIQCIADKQRRGVLRDRSAVQLEATVKAFEAWMRDRPRYVEQCVAEDWTPPVCEVTAADVAGFLEGLRSRSGMVAAAKTRNNARADLRGFFNWCIGLEDDRPLPGCTRRWHTGNPAADVPKVQVKAGAPAVLSVEQCAALMADVERHKGGMIVPYFAIGLFAGIRPGPDGELRKLAVHPHLSTPCREAGGRPLLDLGRGVITILPEIAKTGRKRVVQVQPNLKAWLERYGVAILPPGHDRAIKGMRSAHGLGHDILRHSYVSYHVAAFKSKGGTALQSGNSEAVIDRHYLNLPTAEEGAAFFSIMPTAEPSL